MANIPGINVPDTVRPFTSDDTFPTAYANEVKGGHHQYTTIAERDSIPTARRLEGMFCTVAGVTYQLKGGVANSNWVEFEAGGEGAAGKSAYQLAVSEGFVGTLQDWLDSLQGDTGSQGLTPHIGANGNWFIGTTDTGYAADRFILTELSAEEPGFPTAPNKLTVSFAGQPANTGPKGNPGVPGVDGLDGSDAWSAEWAAVDDGSRRVIRVADWFGGTGAKPASGQYLGPGGFVTYASQATDFRGPGSEGGGGGGGLPENVVVVTNEEELIEASFQKSDTYIIVPGNIVLSGSFVIAGSNITIDGMGLGSIHMLAEEEYMGTSQGKYITIKNIKIKAYGITGFQNKHLLYDNCTLILSSMPFFNNGSYMLRNCRINQGINFNQGATTGAIVTGCAMAGTFTLPPGTGMSAESGNIRNANMTYWGEV